MTEDIHNWDLMSVEEVAGLMSEAPVPWWVAGGWAIDLFLGRQTRLHGDTDVLVRRGDQFAVQALLAEKGLLLYKTQQPGLKPWPAGEFPDRPVDDIWCRRTPDSPWILQLMLLDTEGDQWIFKRDPAIRGSLASLGQRTPAGVPYMCPQIQLLYKAKPQTLAKDQADFDLVVPRMSREQQTWLLRRLEKRFPDGHPWIASLRAVVSQ
ncbi:MAG: amino acid transporter [Kiritimatiellae bacterium]|nr:amino acid transporter [Kiritimatiellia bacterium]